MLTETVRMFSYFEILKLMMLIAHGSFSSQFFTAQLPVVFYLLVETETFDCHLSTVSLVVSL